MARQNILCLGIESTAHTIGFALVGSDKRVHANVKNIFTTQKGGLKPSDVSNHHEEIFQDILKRTLVLANKRFSDIDIIAFSQSPGIGHCLRVGASIARALALKLKKPLVGVNHCIAHLEVGQLRYPMCKDPVMLYASGANTQIIAYAGGTYRIFGETLDMGVGNFLDAFARELGLGFPGGPKIEELAQKGSYIELPYNVKGMDMSFGGILTYIKSKHKQGIKKEDLCFSVQETVFAMLIEVAERALAHTGKQQLLLAGGVACNKRLAQMALQMCENRGIECYIPENQFLLDNAAMIAWLGILMHNAHQDVSISESKINPYLRTDEIKVLWRA